MKPYGPLMVEHRLIERMVKLLERELARIKETKQINPAFIESAVDFFRTYADRTHHGKEEDILFRELSKKNLSKEHKKVMDDLVNDHLFARKTVKALIEAKEKSVQGDKKAANEIQAILKTLINLYPGHIEKEDRHFFIPVMDYFSQKEQDKMLDEFFEFDRNMVHEKYKKLVEQFEEKG